VAFLFLCDKKKYRRKNGDFVTILLYLRQKSRMNEPMRKISVFLVLVFCLMSWNLGAQKNYVWAFKTDYQKVYDFYDGYAIVMTGIKKGFIDRRGSTFVSPKYNIIDAFSEGLASAGYINFKSMESKSGYIDERGEMVIPPVYDVTSPFQEGLACVKKDSLWGFINKAGEMVIRPRYEAAYSFSSGVASVQYRGKWGVIDKTGRFILKPTFDDALGFFETLCCVKKDGKWGFVNRQGEVAIPIVFDYAGSFREGLARVELNGKFGLIDKQGKFFIEPSYEMLYNFSNGLARFKTGDTWGYLDRNKRVAINAEYDSASDFSENLARVRKDGKWGYLNTEGKLVIQPEFDQAYDFREGLARVFQGDEKGFIIYSPSGSKEIVVDKPDAEPEELTIRKVKEGKRIKVNSENIIISLYDHKKIDGDIISLNYNGRWILRNFILKGVYYDLPLYVSEDSSKNYLLLYANNLGKEPPNTVAIVVDDGIEQQKVVLNSDLNQCDIIYFDRSN
jgi:hypothetical protein